MDRCPALMPEVSCGHSERKIVPIPIAWDLHQATGAPAHHHPADDDADRSDRRPRLPRVAGLTGDRSAFVTTRPFRDSLQTIADVDLKGTTGIIWPSPDERAGDGRQDIIGRWPLFLQ
jgi:hypothetical protein